MKSFTQLLRPQRGVALMMVLTTIVILSAVMIEFSFDTNVNKIKTENMEDRLKAKLMAESGLQFAMARLRLYKGAFNFLQKNDKAKDFVPLEVINAIWNFPFVYPIPPIGEMSQIQKEAIAEFTENTVLEGQMSLMIQNISNGLNLNLLRISILAEKELAKRGVQHNQEEEAEFSPEAQLYKFLEKAIEKKADDDVNFEAEFTGTDIQQLINALKYYMSDPQTVNDTSNVNILFADANLKPKFAPLNSFSEIYLIPGWKDALVELIKNDFSAYPSVMIDLNKITGDTLRVLIPNLTDEDITNFFEYRDDSEKPHPINTVNQFKDYAVNTGHWISAEDFDKRFSTFEKYGLRFGPAPTLFRIKSSGTFQRSNYNLTAIVTLPLKPKPAQTTTNNNRDDLDGDDEDEDEDENESDGENPTPNNGNGANPSTNQPPAPDELLEPRIIEISVN